MKVEKWQKINRKELLVHPRMTVVEDIVRLPDGAEASYVRFAPCKSHSVAVLAINTRQELLLQKEYSYPPDAILWQLPGGGMHENETVGDAANRELAEESQLSASNCRQLGYFYTSNRRSDERQHVVICTDLYKKEGQTDPEEFIENHWFSIEKVQNMMAKGEFHNMNLLAALGLFFATHNNQPAKQFNEKDY